MIEYGNPRSLKNEALFLGDGIVSSEVGEVLFDNSSLKTGVKQSHLEWQNSSLNPSLCC